MSTPLPQQGTGLRAGAEALAARAPALLAAAQRLAQTVVIGEHGRARPGQGQEFWQYRQATPGDDARRIDWRRSARGDQTFVQDKEWQTAQAVMLWSDPAAGMNFASTDNLPVKALRARILTLALAIGLARGGERTGLLDMGAGGLRAQRGGQHLPEMARLLSHDLAADNAQPPEGDLPANGRAVLVSDFLGDISGLETALARATAIGAGGAVLQLLDPAEEAFPFGGRTIFESMSGLTRFETLQARDLRDRYLERLAARKDHIARLAAQAGWSYATHHTDRPAAETLLWLHGALARK